MYVGMIQVTTTYVGGNIFTIYEASGYTCKTHFLQSINFYVQQWYLYTYDYYVCEPL